jgi:hypothetical protein
MRIDEVRVGEVMWDKEEYSEPGMPCMWFKGSVVRPAVRSKVVSTLPRTTSVVSLIGRSTVFVAFATYVCSAGFHLPVRVC